MESAKHNHIEYKVAINLHDDYCYLILIREQDSYISYIIECESKKRFSAKPQDLEITRFARFKDYQNLHEIEGEWKLMGRAWEDIMYPMPAIKKIHAMIATYANPNI
jgi:hypothetical protein